MVAFYQNSSPYQNAPRPYSFLYEFLDVNISNPQTGQLLVYNATTKKWENTTSSGGSGTVAATPSGSDKTIQFNNAGAFAGDSLFLFDFTNKRLQIGPILAQSKIHVSGTGNEVSLILQNQTVLTGLAYELKSLNDGSFAVINRTGSQNRLIINSSGNVTPGADNTQTLGSSGLRWSDVYSANAVINTSDQRHKEDIKVSDLGLDFILKLNPVSYKWKEEGNRSHYGFIAQDVQRALSGKDFAGFIYDKESDLYGLRYSEFISPLVRALQEHVLVSDKQYKELKQSIQVLESQEDEDLNSQNLFQSILDPHINNFESSINKIQSDVGYINSDIQNLSNSFETVSLENKSIDSQIEVLKKYNSELRDQVNLLLSKIESLEQSESINKNSVEQTIHTLITELADIRSELSSKLQTQTFEAEEKVEVLVEDIKAKISLIKWLTEQWKKSIDWLRNLIWW